MATLITMAQWFLMQGHLRAQRELSSNNSFLPSFVDAPFVANPFLEMLCVHDVWSRLNFKLNNPCKIHKFPMKNTSVLSSCFYFFSVRERARQVQAAVY